MRAAVLAVVFLVGCAGAEQARKDAIAQDALWTCRCIVTGIARGVSDPGGEEELWVAAGREVLRLDGEEPRVVWTAPLFSEIVRFEVTDLEADGRDEWVVVVDGGGVRSLVVESRDGVRVRRGEAWAGWMRSWDGGDEGMVLGIRAGADRPYWGTVSRLVLGEKGRWEPVGGGPEWPPRVGFFDPFTLPDAPGRMFGLRDDGRVVEYGPATRLASPEQWISDGRPVGRPVELKRTYRSALGEEEDAVVKLPPPVVRDGRSALLVAGTPGAIAVFEDFIIHKGGEVRAMSAGERGVAFGVRTPVIGRAVVGATPWTFGERSVWAAAVWTRAPQEFGPPESRVLLFDPRSGDAVSAVPPASPVPLPPPGTRRDRPSELP